MMLRLAIAIAAVALHLTASVSDAADEPVPILVYHGGPVPHVERTPLTANQSQGLVLDYLTRNVPRALADQRRQVAEASSLDFLLESTFSFHCVGLDASAGACRQVHFIGPRAPAVDLNRFFPREATGLVAVVVNHEAHFQGGRFRVRSLVSFIDREKPAPEGPKFVLSSVSERAPASARTDPLYDFKTSSAPSERERKKRKASREYWFGGEQSRMDAVFLEHLKKVAVALDRFLLADGYGDPAPAFEDWFESLPRGKELFESRDEKCPKSCGKRYIDLEDGHYLIVSRNNGYYVDYIVDYL